MQHTLDLGLLVGVRVSLGAAGRHLLGERPIVVVVAIGRDRRGVDEPRNAGGHGCIEHVARSLDVDVVALCRRLHHDEGEVYDDIGVRNQLVDSGPVQDVPLAVLGLAPAQFARIKRPPRHRQDAPDLGRDFQGTDERFSDLAGRTRDSNGEPGSRCDTRGRCRSHRRSAYSGTGCSPAPPQPTVSNCASNSRLRAELRAAQHACAAPTPVVLELCANFASSGIGEHASSIRVSFAAAVNHAAGSPAGAHQLPPGS